MKKNTCNFCGRKQPITITDNNNYYQFSLPFLSETLMITDRKRDREYLYGINYCPICGKEIT